MTGYDVVVIGGGHAGAEAALAATRLGARTLLITLNPDTLCQMSCNPAIGGQAKGQIVREIDALGGAMALAADDTSIQFRMLNASKGKAVQAPRSQADKQHYHLWMKRFLEKCPGLDILLEEAVDLDIQAGRIQGVQLSDGRTIETRAAIVAAGTFLRGRLYIGSHSLSGGRMAEGSAEALSSTFERAGIRLGRLKTGTPARIHFDSIDLTKCEPQPGDAIPRPFSFLTEKIDRPQVLCYLTYTNARTHQIVQDNLQRTALYSGKISGIGPRYCPSIETKIVRHPGKERHHLFLEPEGLDTKETYVNGLSTSLPADVQEAMIRSIVGLENARIIRYAYAVEYDFVPPDQTQPSLESKTVSGLYFAGQVNGTSGYEEAAAQGLIAGANAALSLSGKSPLVLGRQEAYIGVLIDDLTARGVDEPYRMFSSRAEFRLLLRADNADRRLTPLAREKGLIDNQRWQQFEKRQAASQELRAFLEKTRSGQKTLAELLQMAGNTLETLAADFPEIRRFSLYVQETVETDVRYTGYVRHQEQQIERMQRAKDRAIPAWVDYERIPDLKAEARQKLAKVRPENFARAAQIQGIDPNDIQILLFYVENRGKNGSVSPEP